MFFYISLLIIIIFFLQICKIKNHDKMAAVGTAIILSAVAGLRYRVGTDYPVYMINYTQYKNHEITSMRFAGVYLMARISEFIRDDYATWFFLMSCLTVGIAIFAIYKYSDSFSMSVLLYLFLGCWHNSFNIVKQCAAVSILLLGQKFLFDKDFIKWCIVCIIAASFHISALLMIPVYFLVTRKIDFKQIVAIFFIAIIISLSYERLLNLMSVLKDLETPNLSGAVVTRSVNILRVLVNFAPLILIVFFRKHYTDDEKYRIWANVSMLNSALAFAGMRSVYLTRFCSYTNAFNIFLIPYLLSKSTNKMNKKIIKSACLILYFLFWMYDLQKGSTTATFHWIFER